MLLHKRKFNPEDDLGFGQQAVIRNQRLINRDGSVNVKRRGISRFSTSNNYHNLITMSWGKFWLIILSCYFIANLIFASIYVSFGIESLNGAEGTSFFERFMDAFFF